MIRWLMAAMCGLGWLGLAGAVVAPLVGTAWAIADPRQINTQIVGSPNSWVLAGRSLTLSATAAVVALVLGILPAAVLGSCSRRARPWLLGLVLAPLVVPPQVYAYAWGLLPAAGIPSLKSVANVIPVLIDSREGIPALVGAGKDSRTSGLTGGVGGDSGISMPWVGGAIRAGFISAAWLWPVVALVIAAGWRSTGQAVYRLALLDASPLPAFLRAVLPSLRVHVLAAAALIVGITLIEYPIPHLTLCRVWATELMVLVEVGAPPGQIVRMAVQPMGIMLAVILLVAWAIQSTGGWQPISDEDTTIGSVDRLNNGFRLDWLGLPAWIGAAAIGAATLGIPVALMIRNLRVPGAWMQGVGMFAEQWANSLQVCLAAGFFAVVLAVATVGLWQATGRTPLRWGGLASLLVATVPPPVLGVGLILVFNRVGLLRDAYTQTPLVWILGMVGRYSAIAVLVTWLSVGRRNIVAVEQARVDGGTGLDILAHVLLPLIWPSLLAAGLIVAVLAIFEVVVTQMVAPPAYGSIAMTILNYMHYGRDDAVITSSLTLMAAGVVLTQVCGHFLARVGR